MLVKPPCASGTGVSWTHASQAVACGGCRAAQLCQPFSARWYQHLLVPLQDWPGVPPELLSAPCCNCCPQHSFFFGGALQDWLLSLVPHLVHAASNILADVTATGCHPRDLLPSMLAGQCGGCSAAAVFRWGHAKVAVTPTALLQSWCLPTHLAQPQPSVSECWGAIKLLACVVQLLVCQLQQGWPAPVSCGCLRQCMLCTADSCGSLPQSMLCTAGSCGSLPQRMLCTAGSCRWARLPGEPAAGATLR